MTDANISDIDFSETKNLHNRRVERLSAHKRRTLSFLHHLSTTANSLSEKQIYRYTTCHSYLLFHQYPELKKTKLHYALHCDNHLICPCCAIRRAAKGVKRYEDRVTELLRRNSSLRLYYVVLTVRNDEDLDRAYQHLMNSVKVLTRRRRQAQSYFNTGNKKFISAANSVFAKVAAGAYSVEVKKGQNSCLWHPHINFLLLTEQALYASEIKSEWESITIDSFMASCIEVGATAEQSIKSGLVEIFKYAMKFSDQRNEDVLYAWELLHGRRMMGSFGAFRGIDIQADDQEDLSMYEYEELFYKFSYDTEKYEKSDSFI